MSVIYRKCSSLYENNKKWATGSYLVVVYWQYILLYSPSNVQYYSLKHQQEKISIQIISNYQANAVNIFEQNLHRVFVS